MGSYIILDGMGKPPDELAGLFSGVFGRNPELIETQTNLQALRHFAVAVSEDRTFAVDNLPPGSCWVLAQPGIEVRKQVGGLRSPDAGEDRRKLRRADELTKNEIELKPCQKSDELSALHQIAGASKSLLPH